MDARYITSADGTKLYADAVGDPSNPSIVFIHGFALSASAFDNIFIGKRYADRYYLVRYDLRGHGRSGKPGTAEGYTSKKFADDFAAVMASFGLTKPIVVGWSYGATVLADIAANLPADTLAGAVCLGAVPFIGPILHKVATSELIEALGGLQEESDVSASARSFLAFSDMLFLDAESVDWDIRCKWNGMASFQLPMHRRFLLTRQHDPTKLLELGEENFPMLVIHGRHDRHLRAEPVVEEMRSVFKSIQVCVIEKGGSHAVHLENETEVMANILQFATARYLNSQPLA